MKTASKKPSVSLMFRAFSDRTRLRILHLLTGGELCVCDLARVIRSPQPTVSRHLAYLRRANLISARKQGLWTYYQLSPARNTFHQKLMECLTCCFNDVPELATDAKRLAAGCCEKGSCCD